MSDKKFEINELISDIRIKPIENLGNLKAFVDIVIGGGFVVKSLKVIDGNKGLFVSMPSVKNNKGEYNDIFHAISSEAYSFLQNSVKEKYNEKVGSGNKTQQSTPTNNENNVPDDTSIPF